MRKPEESKIPWPDWAVGNALAILESARDRHISMVPEDDSKAAVNDGIINALNLGISVVKGINEHTPPQPVPPEVVAHRAVSKFANELADAFENLAGNLRRVDEWDWPERD